MRLGGLTLADRVVVAGGGGGLGSYGGPDQGAGGSGGSFSSAQAGDNGACSGSGGDGGTSSVGGTGGTGTATGTAGSLGSGGTGGSNSGHGGGGGGGGYYGGGGGATCTTQFSGGGGGGSDYVEASATSVEDYPGYSTGNGSVTLTYPPSTSSSSPHSGTKLFSYTGAVQTWTVPAGVTSVQVSAIGAQGGDSYGGLGSEVVATVPVIPGQAMVVVVGGAGGNGPGGYNGGGSGGAGGNNGTGGGGASDVRLGGLTLADRVVVAGGGGGLGSYGGPDQGAGGSGGSFGSAQAGDNGACSGSGGGGGTSSVGGTGGTGTATGTAGSLGSGGTGGSNSGHGGGGGGGGYYGGGGGGTCTTQFSGGGGGGSDYVESSATSVQDVPGYSTGNGSVTLVYSPGPTATLTSYEADGAVSGSATNLNECEKGTKVGDPVDCATGDLYETATDDSIPGRGVPLDLTRTYNSLSASVDGPFGYGWSCSYCMSLSIDDGTGTATVTQEDGSTVVFTSNGDGVYTAPPYDFASLVANPGGTYIYTRRGSQIFNFSASGQLVSESDPNGYLTTLSYNGSGQLTAVTDPAGRQLSFSYGSNGLVSEVTDPADRTVSYGYDSSGELTSVTDLGGGITSFTYGAGHLLSTMTAPNGGVTTNTFNSSGQVTQQVDPMGRTTTFAYSGDNLSPAGGTTTVTDPEGNVTVEDYVSGALISETQASGTSQAATTTYQVDPGTLSTTAVVDPDGNITTYRYDADGNLVSEVDPLGQTTTWTYNAYDEVTSETLPASYGPAGTVTTTYTYDEAAYSSGGAGNLTTVSTPIVSPLGTVAGDQVTHFVHGDSTYPGDVTAVIDPDGNTWAFAYDSYGDLVSETAPATTDNSDVSGSYQDLTLWAYDTGTGQVTSQLSGRYMLAHPSATSCTTPATGCTTYTYNADGDLLTTTDGNGHITTNTYDGNGNVISTTDPDGNETVYGYDLDDELTATAQAFGTSSAQTYTIAYWPDGEVKTQTNPAGAVTSYTYDPLGHLASVTDPDGRTSGYTYDGDGNLIVKSDPGVSGCTTSSTTTGCTVYTYDGGELTGIKYNDPATPDVFYTYDPDGRLNSMSDGTGTSTWSYDSLGRLASYTNGVGDTLGYSYDPAGNQLSVSYPGTIGTVADGLRRPRSGRQPDRLAGPHHHVHLRRRRRLDYWYRPHQWHAGHRQLHLRPRRRAVRHQHHPRLGDAGLVHLHPRLR